MRAYLLHKDSQGPSSYYSVGVHWKSILPVSLSLRFIGRISGFPLASSFHFKGLIIGVSIRAIHGGVRQWLISMHVKNAEAE